MMPTQYSERTKRLALDTYKRCGLNEASRRLEGVVSRSRIHRWAKEAGAKPPTLDQKKKQGHIYNRAKRLKLNDRLFDRLERTLTKRGANITPNELKSLILSYAILTDKRRTEDGEDKNLLAEPVLTPEQVLEGGEIRIARMEREMEEQYPKGKGKRRKALAADISDERNLRAQSNGHG